MSLTEIKTKSLHCFKDEHGASKENISRGVKTGKSGFIVSLLTTNCTANITIMGLLINLRDTVSMSTIKKVTFDVLPYPRTEEDRMYFTLKYNIPLLPVDTKC